MAKRYWLFKSEPDVYSIAHLKRDKKTYWDGVRNYQARNLLRDEIKVGDGVLFYHSSVKPMVVAGTAKVVKAGYPDPEQFNPESKYFDPDSPRDDPRWFVVDIAFEEEFSHPVTRDEMKEMAALKDMMVLRRGARLSVQPVTATEWKAIVKRGNSAHRA
jgi:predicted RNA-binding protein with PUA-like domain